MTTIVAKQLDDKVIFGSDTLVTADRKFSHPKQTKVVKRGHFLVAGAGESAACDIAQHIWNPPAPSSTDKKDLYHFVIAKVIPTLRQAFKDNDYKWDKESIDGDYNFAFLLAIGGEVFDIADDFAVSLDSDGIYGIGSGSSLAIGALKAGATIEQALEIAASKDPYTAPPFQYFEQLRK